MARGVQVVAHACQLQEPRDEVHILVHDCGRRGRPPGMCTILRSLMHRHLLSKEGGRSGPLRFKEGFWRTRKVRLVANSRSGYFLLLWLL
jgi:hypothetical protein